jgi:hypothetical protein
LSFTVSLKEFRAVCRSFKVKEVGVVKLGQQLDDILLSRRLVRISRQALLPHRLNPAIRAKPYEKFMGLRTESEELIVEGVMKDVPGFAAE